MTEEQTAVAEMVKVVELVSATNESLVITDPVKQALIEDLGPIAEGMALYRQFASEVVVENQAQANAARKMEKRIAEDVKTVKEHPVLSGMKKGFDDLHKRWVGLSNRFVPPMETDRKTIRTTRIDWEEAEKEKARAEERKLQAAADEKARKEREQQERLECYQREKEEEARRAAQEALDKAAAAKDEVERKKFADEAERRRKEADAAQVKADMRRENAEAVAAPVVQVSAPSAKGGSRLYWEVEVKDKLAFLRAIPQRPDYAGYVEVLLSNLKKAKAANPMLEIPGVEFKQVRK